MGNEESIKLENLNVIVSGKNGVGKRTLINALFKSEIVRTGIKADIFEQIIPFTDKKIPLKIYDTPDFNINQNEQSMLMQKIQNLITTKKKTNDINQYIHCLWYCVDSHSTNIDPVEMQFINSISNIPIILVLTKSDDFDAANNLLKQFESATINVKNIVLILAQNTCLEDAFGINQLLHYTLNSLPPCFNTEQLRMQFELEHLNDDPTKTKKINVILTGKIGTGKSTLINSILKKELAHTGIGYPVTKKIDEFTNEECDFKLFDTPGFEENPQQQNKVKKQIVNLIKERSKTADINQFIHCIWYCVNCGSNRIESDEINYINSLIKFCNSQIYPIPIFVVLTQSYYEYEIQEMMKSIEQPQMQIRDSVAIIANDHFYEENGETKCHKAKGVLDLTSLTKAALNFNDKEGMKKIIETIKKASKKKKPMKKMNIIVSGRTGAGKSELINNFFRGKLAATGIGLPVTQVVRPFSKPGNPLTIYDIPGFEQNPKQQKIVKKSIYDLIKNGAKTKDYDNCIHFMWYCVNIRTNRIDPEEIKFIKELRENTRKCKIPIVVILTQSYSRTEADKMKSFVESLNLDVCAVIPVVAREKIEDDGTVHPQYGMDELVNIMEQNIDNSLKETFINVQIASIPKKIGQASAVVAGFSFTGGASGASPIPFSDFFILVGNEVLMLLSITAIFGVEVSHGFIAMFLSCTIGCGTASLLGRFAVVNILKCIPGVGSIIGGVVSGATAVVLTAALGGAYIAIMEAILRGEFDPNKITKKELMAKVAPIFKLKLKEAKEEQERKEKKKDDDEDEKKDDSFDDETESIEKKR